MKREHFNGVSLTSWLSSCAFRQYDFLASFSFSSADHSANSRAEEGAVPSAIITFAHPYTNPPTQILIQPPPPVHPNLRFFPHLHICLSRYLDSLASPHVPVFLLLTTVFSVCYPITHTLTSRTLQPHTFLLSTLPPPDFSAFSVNFSNFSGAHFLIHTTLIHGIINTNTNNKG